MERVPESKVNLRLNASIVVGILTTVIITVLLIIMRKEVATASGLGISAGIIITFLMFILFTIVERRLEAKKPKLETGEELIYSSMANYYGKLKIIGGHLYLTTKRIIFSPHSFNGQQDEFIILRKNIKQAKANKNMGIVENRLELIDQKGKSHLFVVYSPKVWIEKLNLGSDQK
ncbi:MAG TPA: hypothetical protein PLZ08_08905 [Bacillota bacterium]|jgi:hypothetical protein|nr:hypothetical protein [Bacillota bacterium]HOL10652.1 hypothetical protein [Bacillota bacterium]HPO98055.1 hypothetical protein [Bacillota bacterium]